MYKTVILGSLGAGSIEAVNAIPPVNNTVEVFKLALQAIVALATVIGIFKKPKNLNNGTTSQE